MTSGDPTLVRPAAPAAAPTNGTHGAADDAAAHGHAPRRPGGDPLFQVRTADLEPYTGLRYLSKLFRVIALLLVLLMLAEIVTGLVTQGTESLPTLVAEASRLIVLAALLWGVGDLSILLIDLGHDVRAARILLGRQTAHLLHPTGGAPATPAIVSPGATAAAGSGADGRSVDGRAAR